MVSIAIGFIEPLGIEQPVEGLHARLVGIEIPSALRRVDELEGGAVTDDRARGESRCASDKAQGEGEDEGADDKAETVDAVEFTFHLQAMDMDKATLKTWGKGYFQGVRAAMKAKGKDPETEIKPMMGRAPGVLKFFMAKAALGAGCWTPARRIATRCCEWWAVPLS